MNWQERAENAEAELARLREQIKVEWLPVVGFEGLYEVSSNGDIRNVRTGNIAAKSLMGDGYVKANLWKKGKRKQTSAHRVVAEAFIGGIDGLEINHRNGVKTDNRVSNLEITTRSGNVNHSYYELGHIIKPILATSTATGDTTEYRSIEEAVRLGGFRSSSIYDCLNGKVKTHSGHSFSRPAAPVPAVAAKQSQSDSLAVSKTSDRHVCGLQGFGNSLDDVCPACAHEHQQIIAPAVPDDRVSQDAAALMQAACALALYRAGEIDSMTNEISEADRLLEGYSTQLGMFDAQRVYKMYGPLDAVVEHGLRESLYEKKQVLLEMIVKGGE